MRECHGGKKKKYYKKKNKVEKHNNVLPNIKLGKSQCICITLKIFIYLGLSKAIPASTIPFLPITKSHVGNLSTQILISYAILH